MCDEVGAVFRLAYNQFTNLQIKKYLLLIIFLKGRPKAFGVNPEVHSFSGGKV